MLTCFKRIASDIAVRPLREAIERSPSLWDEITARQTTPGSPHADTQAIILRWARDQSVEAAFTELTAVNYPAYDKLPEARDLIESLMHTIGAKELGRAMVVSLKAGGHIPLHEDQGAYADHYERFHIALQSDDRNSFLIETDRNQGEWVHMKEGEAWWFNHKRPHQLWNLSSAPRLHLIVDAVSKPHRKERATHSRAK